jgi:hypothetical protein
MKKRFVKYLFICSLFGCIRKQCEAQKKTGKAPAKRAMTKKTTKTKTKAKINPAAPAVDTVAVAAVTPTPAAPPAPPVNDSLPIKLVKPSQRRDAAVDDDAIKDRTPLPYGTSAC